MRRSHLHSLLLVLVTAVVTELVLLRTATRTLIHIPGLGRFESPIGFLAEVGRFAYYLAVVTLLATLVVLAVRGLRGGSPRGLMAGVVGVAFVAVAAGGRLGVLPWSTVGWLALVLVANGGLLAWTGRRSLPVGIFLVGVVAAGVSVLAQGDGGGLTGTQMNFFVWVAEGCVVLFGLTAPLLLGRAPSRVAVAVGAASAVAVAAAFSAGASTLTILVLWNIGVPGWLPGIAYAVAFGGVMTTVWAAAARGDHRVAVGVVLLVGGGIGLISTYQTGLVLAAVLLLGETRDVPLPHPDPAGHASDRTRAARHPREKSDSVIYVR